MGAAKTGLRVVVGLFGALVVFTALNRVFGGIPTLGWQGPSDFVAVAKAGEFAVQDSHTRFLGGVWLAVGLGFLTAAWQPEAMKQVLLFLCGAVFLGGVARFSNLDLAVLFGPGVGVSLALEMMLMPVVAVWVMRTVR